MHDLDHFRVVNDTYGHLCGDAILAAVGHRIRDIPRDSDTKCRYGGEEFMALLPETPRPGALHVAESLRQQLAETSAVRNGAKVSMTASVGLAMDLHKEVDTTALIGRADADRSRVEHSGRNQVCEAALANNTPPAAAAQAVKTSSLRSQKPEGLRRLNLSDRAQTSSGLRAPVCRRPSPRRAAGPCGCAAASL